MTSDVKITMAIKPKHPTRKAVDSVLDNRGDLLNLVTVNTAQQAIALMDTCYVAIVVDGSYYPVEVENVAEQLDLVIAGEAPTVEQDVEFGVPGIENFVGAPEEDLPIQKDMKVYAGILKGNLIKIYEPTEAYDKRGYYVSLTFDSAAAGNAGYTEIMLNGEAIADTNLLYLGASELDVAKARFMLTANYTPTNAAAEEDEEEVEASLVTEALENRLSPLELILSTNDKVGVPAISVDGKEYSTLQDAIEAISTSGTIHVAKSLNLSDSVTINGGKEIYLELDNATITFAKNKRINVLGGADLSVMGTGAIVEAEPYYAPIMCTNLDPKLEINVYIDKGIKLSGWAGLFYNKASYNINAVVDGEIEFKNDGSDDGAGLYVNGNVLSGSCVLNGWIHGEGHGVYCPGNIDLIICSKIEGTQGGVEVKSGTLTIAKTANISTSYVGEATMVANNNGTCSTGCGLAVAYAVVDRQMRVIVNGGTISGACAFMQGNPSKIKGALEHTEVSILDGLFTSSGEEVVKTFEEDGLNKFIMGGKFNKEPDKKFLAPGYTVEMVNGRYTVSKV